MARIMMTGMCTVHDRLAYHADSTRVYYRPFFPSVKTYAELLEQFRIAANTGNYLITEGAYRAFDGHNIDYIPFWYLYQQRSNREFLKWMSNEFELCLFTTANILNVALDLTNEVEVLERLPMATVFMSIGVQRRSDLAGALPPGAARFIDFLKRDRSFTFTRGSFAADFLRSQGVKNVHDACCPSAFNHPEQIVKGVGRLKELSVETLGEVWINGYLGEGPEASLREIKAFLPISKRLGYVFQDEPLLFGALRNMEGQSAVYEDGTGALTQTPACHFSQYSADSVSYYAFFSPGQWRARAAAVDLFVGRRFHGNLVGLQAGRPALFIAHDDRVTEMLDSVGIPYVLPSSFHEAPDRVKFFDNFIRSINIGQFEDKYGAKTEAFRICIKSLLSRVII
jgi:hypothetical protein